MVQDGESASPDYHTIEKIEEGNSYQTGADAINSNETIPRSVDTNLANIVVPSPKNERV